jgi:hypothetical protein
VAAIVRADAAIDRVLKVVSGLPVYVAGSSVAAAHYPNIDVMAYDDIDLFCGSGNTLIATAQLLQGNGFELEGRSQRVWQRWLRYGFKTWHTNSVKLKDKAGIEVNLVYKLVDGHPTTSLAQVIESFDFGLLAMGYEGETGQFRDARSYLFPGRNPDGALPLMPNKDANWRNGFISQYNGLREVGRYVKYHDYGFDLSLVKDTLVTGYWAAADYHGTRSDKPEHLALGKIYEAIAIHMEDDAWDKLRDAGKEILFLDDLDKIMEHLE